MSTTGVSFKIGADNTDALKALAELRDEFKSLRDQLKTAATDIKIKVLADAAGLHSEISTIKNQIKSQIGLVEVDVKVKADNASIAASAAHIKSQLRTALGTVDIALNVSANQTALNSDLLLIRNRVNAYFATGVAVRIVPTLTAADSAAAKVKLQGLVNNTYQAKVGINLVYLNSQIALARTMLSSLGSGVNINVDATASNLIHALNELKAEVIRLRTAMSSGSGGGLGGGAGGNTGVLAGLKANIASLMAVATGGVFAAITVGTAEYVRELERASQLTNVTTQQMQQLAYATSTVGISLEKSSDIFKDVQDKMGDIITTAGGELKDFFEKIAPKVGVTVEQFYNLSGPDALQLYFNSLQKANVSQAELIFYMEAIANDASVLIPLLKDNGAEFQRLSEQAVKLGIILDDVSISKVKAFQSAFGQVKNTVAGLTTVLGVELAPALTDISNKFVEFAVENADGIRGTLGSVADLFTDILSVADTVFTEIGNLWNDLTGSIEDETGVQIGLFDILSAAFQGVGLAFRMVALLIKSLIEIVKNVVREMVLDGIDDFNKFMSGINQLKIVATYALDSLVIAFQSFARVVQSAFSLDWNGVKNNWVNGLNQLKGLANQKQQELLAEQQDLKTKLNVTNEQRNDNNNERNTNINEAADKLIGEWFTRQLERNTPKLAPTFNKTGGGLKGSGYVAPPDDKKDKVNKAKSDAAAKRAADEAKRDAEALRRAEYEHKQSMLKMSIDNIQFEYDQNQRSLEDYYNLKRKYILESSRLEILELARRKLVAKDDAEKQQLDTKILEVKNNTKLDGQKLEIFRRDKATDNINKDIASILSENDYFQRYGDIQANMNPMNRPKIEEQQRQIKLATIEQLKQKLIELQSLENSGAEGITEKVQNLTLKIKELEASAPTVWQEFRNNLVDTGITAAASGLGDFFYDLVTGAKSAGDAIKDFARNFISSLLQMASQALAKIAIFAALNALTGGAASAGTGFAGMAAKALGFSATQLHGGGEEKDGKKRVIKDVKDIKSNEFLAILEDTEEVVTKNDPRHIKNFDMNAHLAKLMPRTTGTLDALMQPDSDFMQTINNIEMRPQAAPNNNGSPNVVTKVIVAFTEEQVAEHMASSAGERVQLNTVQRNIGAIKQMLADD
ncbi:hypothetical protein [Acinetobacter sp.]|uniref:hypothetical protein n=1 Tax=Acinetobacter sp. TaxID=472 RepID=UPI002FDB48D0